MKLKKANSYVLHALMYMVRHATQLPITAHAIAKAEGIPYRQLVTLFGKLTKAGILKNVAERKGYVFEKSPGDIVLLEIFELVEGTPLFQECFMDYYDCGAPHDHCLLYELWRQSTVSLEKKLAETTLEDAAWGHPEHYFER